MRDVCIASNISIILGLAQSLQAQRPCSMYQWSQARSAASKAGVPFTCQAPPPSALPELIKSLKTDSHATLSALGIGNGPPAAFYQGGPPRFNPDRELYMPPDQRKFWIFTIDEMVAELHRTDKVRSRLSYAALPRAMRRSLLTVIRILWHVTFRQTREAGPDEALPRKQYRDAMAAAAICILLGLAEALECFHYRATMKWWRRSISSPAAAKTPPKAPYLCQYLGALREAAKWAVPILGVKVDVGTNGRANKSRRA